MTQAAQQSFLCSLDDAHSRELRALAGWEPQLEAALRSAQEIWGAEWLSTNELAADLGQRLRQDTAPAETWLGQLHPADLYLACACTRGIPAAIDAFERVYMNELLPLARRFEKPSISADDLLQLLRARLFVAQEGGVAKLSSYTGRGQLGHWLRVTAGRLFLDVARVQSGSLESPALEEAIAMAPAADADPELELLKRRHAARFKQAVAETLGGMGARDRFLLRQHIVEQLSIDQIGALYGVHRATAARWLARARDILIEGTRAALTRDLGLSPHELDSFLGLIVSRLDASLDRLLADASAAEN